VRAGEKGKIIDYPGSPFRGGFLLKLRENFSYRERGRDIVILFANERSAHLYSLA